MEDNTINLMKAILSAIIGLHMITGSFCMMSMAGSQDLSPNPVSHEHHTVMAMSPLLPMSPLSCENCTTLEKEESPMHATTGDFNCNGGLCLTQTTAAAHSLALSPPLLVSFVSSFPSLPVSSAPFLYSQRFTHGPPLPASPSTIILRC